MGPKRRFPPILVVALWGSPGCGDDPSYSDLLYRHQRDSPHEYLACEVEEGAVIDCDGDEVRYEDGLAETAACLAEAWSTCTPAQGGVLSPSGSGGLLHVFIEPGEDGCRAHLFHTGLRPGLERTTVIAECTALPLVASCTLLDDATCTELDRIHTGDPFGPYEI